MKTTPETYTTLISAETVAQNINNLNWVFVDCRFSLANTESGWEGFEEAHMPNAVYFDLDEDLSSEIIPGTTGRHPLPKVSDFADFLYQMGIQNDSQVVVYDDSNGAFSGRVWWMLNWMGHENIAVLDGGWQAWITGGYETVSGPSNPIPGIFTPTEQLQKNISAETVAKIREDDDYKLIDARAIERYLGRNEPIDPVAGHIPGALSAPWLDNLGSDGLFKSKDKLRERFEYLLNGTPAKNVVFYCGSGVTACHNILAMKHAGLGEAKLYPGSWSDWITDKSRPIEVG